jgi:hypothetical protein
MAAAEQIERRYLGRLLRLTLLSRQSRTEDNQRR